LTAPFQPWRLEDVQGQSLRASLYSPSGRGALDYPIPPLSYYFTSSAVMRKKELERRGLLLLLAAVDESLRNTINYIVRYVNSVPICLVVPLLPRSEAEILPSTIVSIFMVLLNENPDPEREKEPYRD
jgi:hypothetical protein